MRKVILLTIGGALVLVGCTVGRPEEPDNPKVLSDICPVNGSFEASYDSDIRYCDCPAGYLKDSNIIGYEVCYGDAECPILEVECVKQ